MAQQIRHNHHKSSEREVRVMSFCRNQSGGLEKEERCLAVGHVEKMKAELLMG